jgi:hypothetical protein
MAARRDTRGDVGQARWPGWYNFDLTRTIALLLVALSTGVAADLKPEAVQAYDRYTRETEARLDANKGPFLWAEASPERLRRVRQGQIIVEPRSGNGDTSVPGALIHDWIGAVFIPDTTLEKTLAVLQDYDHQKAIYHDVLDSKLLSRNGNDFKYYRLRQLKKGIIDGVFRTDFAAHYQQIDATRWICRTRSTLVAEVENYGKPNQHELPPGRGSGYLWRLNGYWRLEQRDNGVYLECEAISMTRGLPPIVGGMFAPAMRSLESEGLAATLQATRDAARK